MKEKHAKEQQEFDAAELQLRATYIKGLYDLYAATRYSHPVGPAGIRAAAFLVLHNISVVQISTLAIDEPRAFIGSVGELLRYRPEDVHRLIDIALGIDGIEETNDDED